MAVREMIEEGLASLLGFGLAVASAVVDGGVELTVRGDEDPDGDEELDGCEVWSGPLRYRPQDPSAAGQMEALFVRHGDERVVIGTRDRRFELEPVEGEVIIHAFGADGSAQARISLAADGTITVTGDTVVVAADNVYLGDGGATKHVAYREDVESALTAMRSKYNAHTHLETGATTDPPLVAAQFTDPGALGSGNILSE